MKIISEIQGSESWKKMRLSKITATDTATILNKSPFSTPKDLWEQKLGIQPPTPVNKAMTRGSELEERARLLLNELTGIEFTPIVVLHDDYEWMMASLDGYNEDNNVICEIKSPNEDTHRLAIEGIIKEYYICQVQKQLLCTGASRCYYFSYRPEYHIKLAIIEVFPDLELHKIIIEKEYEFYVNMCTMQEPEIWVMQTIEERKIIEEKLNILFLGTKK